METAPVSIWLCILQFYLTHLGFLSGFGMFWKARTHIRNILQIRSCFVRTAWKHFLATFRLLVGLLELSFIFFFFLNRTCCPGWSLWRFWKVSSSSATILDTTSVRPSSSARFPKLSSSSSRLYSLTTGTSPLNMLPLQPLYCYSYCQLFLYKAVSMQHFKILSLNLVSRVV